MKDAIRSLRQIQKKIIRMSRREAADNTHCSYSVATPEPIQDVHFQKKRPSRLTVKKKVPAYH